MESYRNGGGGGWSGQLKNGYVCVRVRVCLDGW